MTTRALSMGLAANAQGLKFKLIPTSVTIKGDIHRADGAIVLQDIFAGDTTTSFQLPAGDYYYEFGYQTKNPAKFIIHLPGAKKDCDPPNVDPANGTLDQITNFTV